MPIDNDGVPTAPGEHDKNKELVVDKGDLELNVKETKPEAVVPTFTTRYRPGPIPKAEPHTSRDVPWAFSKHENQKNGTNSGTPKWIHWTFLLFLVVIVALLAATVALVKQKSSENGASPSGTLGLAVGTKRQFTEPPSSPPSTSSPSAVPSPALSVAPTAAPTTGLAFTPISGITRAQQLQTVSNCDDCHQDPIPMPIIFTWRDQSPVSHIIVSSNGFVYLNCDNMIGNMCGEVDVVSMDLTPSVSGGIWTLIGPPTNSTSQNQHNDTFTVSFENVALYGEPGTFVNAQIVFQSNGSIRLCWGQGKVSASSTFTAGVQDLQTQELYPATVDGFIQGQSRVGRWPANQYETFLDPNNPTIPIIPTMFPTPTFTSFPTFYVSQAPNVLFTTPPLDSNTPFTFLFDMPDAIALHHVSSCDDCAEIVTLPFGISWDGYVVQNVLVDSNGYIDLGPCIPDTNFTCGLIAVADNDLKPSVRGGVWTWDDVNSGAFIVSWEGIPFYTEPKSFAYAQAKFYTNGTIELCWGPGALYSGADIVAGVYDGITEKAYPATIAPFVGGTAVTWPSNRCQVVRGQSLNETQPLTPYEISRSALFSSQFSHLANTVGSTLLKVISTCDDCEQAIQLPVVFHWLGEYSFSEISVSSNGQIQISPTDCPLGCAVTIDVAAGDLDPSALRNGTIWYVDIPPGPNQNQSNTGSLENHSVAILWENIPFYLSPSSAISAKAQIFVNGTVELCWGNGVGIQGKSISAGITDSKQGISIPASGNPFDLSGRTLPGTYPENFCQRFEVILKNSSVVTASPSSVLPSVSSRANEPSTVVLASLPTFLSSSQQTVASPSGSRSCTPTTGRCISSAEQLTNELSSVAPNQTVAICGNSTLMTTSRIVVSQSNIILCCMGGPNEACKFQNMGTSKILLIKGANSTLRNLAFESGHSSSSGGNVMIDAVGSHGIADCEFYNGNSKGYGGNLYVQNADRIEISGSIFKGGNAEMGGGGIAIVNTTKVSIVDTLLVNNSAGNASSSSSSPSSSSSFEDTSGGGAVLLQFGSKSKSSADSSPTVSFLSTKFINNTALNGFGGGLFQISGIGSTPLLAIERSTFTGNGARWSGGAGAISPSSVYYEIEWSRNAGFNNTILAVSSSNTCEDFAILGNAENCVNITSNFSYPSNVYSIHVIPAASSNP